MMPNHGKRQNPGGSSGEKKPQEVPPEIQSALNDMAVMIQQGDAEKIVQHCKRLAPLLSEVSSSQIRNVFGPVKRMQLEWTSEISDERAREVYKRLVLLRPKLEYMVARTTKKEAKVAMQYFQQVIDMAIQKVGEGRDLRARRLYFENFVAFFESLVAYHKQHEKQSRG